MIFKLRWLRLGSKVVVSQSKGWWFNYKSTCWNVSRQDTEPPSIPICAWIIIALSGNLYAVFGVYAPHIWNKVENCSNQKLISHTYAALGRPTLSVLIYMCKKCATVGSSGLIYRFMQIYFFLYVMWVLRVCMGITKTNFAFIVILIIVSLVTWVSRICCDSQLKWTFRLTVTDDISFSLQGRHYVLCRSVYGWIASKQLST